MQQQFGGADDGGGAFTAAQGLHGEVEGGQGRALGGVDGLPGPAQAEQRGQPAGQAPVAAAGHGGPAAAEGRGGQQRVVAGAGADEDTDRARGAVRAAQRVQPGSGAARVLQRFPGGLQEEPLLRVRQSAFLGGELEELRVEVGGTVQEVPALPLLQGEGPGRPAGASEEVSRPSRRLSQKTFRSAAAG